MVDMLFDEIHSMIRSFNSVFKRRNSIAHRTARMCPEHCSEQVFTDVIPPTLLTLANIDIP